MSHRVQADRVTLPGTALYVPARQRVHRDEEFSPAWELYVPKGLGRLLPLTQKAPAGQAEQEEELMLPCLGL